MENKARTMLENMYALFNDKVNDKRKAWDYLLELLAVDNRGSVIFEIGHKFEWLFNDSSLSKKVLEVYDDELMKQDYRDHLGDMYLHHVVPKSEELAKARYIKKHPNEEELAELISPLTEEILKFYDPFAGTGRLLMAAHKKAPRAKCFGIEKDLDLYRIAVTNFAIFNIPGYLLHENHLSYKADSSNPLLRHNWKYANHWNPIPDIEHLAKTASK
jgi:DNA modification methylase